MCHKNDIAFWAWAVLEEGMLVPPKKNEQKSIMKWMFQRKRQKLSALYAKMEKIAENHGIKAPQVAMSYVSSKGMVPICGCRKPYQVKDLADAVKIQLDPQKIQQLEKASDACGVRFLGADMFRFAVKKR